MWSRRSSREADRTDRLLRAISGDGGDAVLVHQDAHVFVSHLDPGAAVAHPLGDGRGVYLYVIEGDVDRERRADGHGRRGRDRRRAGGRDRAATSASELILVDVQL